MNEMLMNFKMLEKLGFKVAPYIFVENSRQAIEEAERLGYPIVLKLGAGIHKTDIGGVITDIHNAMDLSDAWTKISKNLKEHGIKYNGLILQKQISGTELIVGLKEDKIFGNVILLGSGGILVELLKDVSFRVCPIKEKDAAEMIQEIKSYELLKGIRGKKPADIEKLKDFLIKMSKIHEKEEIKEMDINPLIVNESDCWIADVRIV